MAKRDYLKEARDGFEKWIRFCAYVWVIWIFLDVLPHLPTEVGKRIVDAIFKKLGI